MSTRPRPVTATVTKPRWMEMPDAQAIAHARRHSLGSTGSTASLVSVLDHDSYMSVPSDSELEAPKVQLVRRRSPKRTKTPESVKSSENHVQNENEVAESSLIMSSTHTSNHEENGNDCDQHAEDDRRSKSVKCGEQNLSPWETWLIRKTQEERDKKKRDSQRKKKEKMKKLEQEKDKQMKEEKAQQVRMEWKEKKDYEEMLRKKLEKQKLRNEKKEKEEKERQIREKSAANFKLWMKEKQAEERERKRLEKEKKRREEEEKNRKMEEAERKFREWKIAAAKRPKSAPNSFGYLDGQLKGYHDTAAYPKPSFYNPIPWQPIHIPRVKNEKPKRTKQKKYVWNPNKYY